MTDKPTARIHLEFAKALATEIRNYGETQAGAYARNFVVLPAATWLETLSADLTWALEEIGRKDAALRRVAEGPHGTLDPAVERKET